MLDILAANLSTIVVALLVAALFVGACRKLWKDHRAGKHSCSCGCGCSGCPNSSLCCDTKHEKTH